MHSSGTYEPYIYVLGAQCFKHSNAYMHTMDQFLCGTDTCNVCGKSAIAFDLDRNIQKKLL